jgi:FlaA1/EpsC-like NDP-sugar epimerase
MVSVFSIIGREKELFCDDINNHEYQLKSIISSARFLVLGGAGSIGQAVTKEIFQRKPLKLHVVDLSENNTVELVRDIRSSFGYIKGDFQTFILDIGSTEYDAFIERDGKYDYILNLSALKHVRSERDPFTLMRMIATNILNTEKTLIQSIKNGAKKYFCVSTDKATNPINMMGASKLIMEMYLMRRSNEIDVSTARFANVAFSDGSLLHGFNQRIQKRQPIVAPKDIRRYFITAKESGELCLMSCIFGNNRDIFFPKLDKELHLKSFSEVAIDYLKQLGYEPKLCDSEDQARESKFDPHRTTKWPCFFSESDTTGEKYFEEFFTGRENLDFDSYGQIGIIKNAPDFNNRALELFLSEIYRMRASGKWSKCDLVNLFNQLIPGFDHVENGKNLDGKM